VGRKSSLARLFARPEAGALAGAIIIYVFFFAVAPSLRNANSFSSTLYVSSTYGLMVGPGTRDRHRVPGPGRLPADVRLAQLLPRQRSAQRTPAGHRLHEEDVQGGDEAMGIDLPGSC
jgi:hypothetical protein